MFEDKPYESNIATTRPVSASHVSPDAPFNWAKASEQQLLTWYDEIRAHIPAFRLANLNVEEELLLQFHHLRLLQKDAFSDKDVPTNQRTQVGNAVAAALVQISKLQLEMYSSERFKAIELLLIRTLNKLPEDVAAFFLEEYEKILAEHAPKVT
jgi:hypothetical protein